MIMAIAVVVLVIGLSLMLWGMDSLLNSVDCGDVLFCLEEKAGVILMTFGVLGASFGFSLLNRAK